MTRPDLYYLFRGLIVVTFLFLLTVHARGQTGWVDQLQSAKGGICCFDNDGRRLDDPEWRTVGDAYEVLFTEGWIRVPTDAVVSMRNLDGVARVWSFPGGNGRSIRCFLPGAMG